MQFSVLISAYNYREFVCQAVDSVLEQTCPPCEILVVDDGSTDGTAARIRQRYARQPLLRVIEQENAGQLAAFVLGIQACQGSHIAFLDADDWWSQGYLERCKRLFEQQPDVEMLSSNPVFAGGRSGPYFKDLRDRRLGLAALRVMMRHSILGSPTSAVCIEAGLARRLAELPAWLHADWRTEADSLLHLGAALLGACHYYLGSCQDAHYRVHESNRFAGRDRNAVFRMRRHLRLGRAADWYTRKAGLGHGMLRHAVGEFATIERPTARECLTYLWLQWRAEEPLAVRLAKLWRIARQYLGAGGR